MPAGSEDRVAEIESEVHIVPALQVVFGERQADRSDGRVIDERGFGDVLHLFAGQPPVVAVHGIKSRAQEEIGQQIESGHQTAGQEVFRPVVGHESHLGVYDGLIGRQRHQCSRFGLEPGVRGPDGVDVESEREPFAAGQVEIAVPLEFGAEPFAVGIETSLTSEFGGFVPFAPRDVDAREGYFGPPARVENLVERVAGDIQFGAEEGEARQVGVGIRVGKGGVVAVGLLSSVEPQRCQAVVCQRHGESDGEESLVVLDRFGVIDRREVAEVAVPQVQDFEIVGIVEREGFPKVEVRAPAQRTGRIGRADVNTGESPLRHAADRVVVETDECLVESRRLSAG